MSAVFKYIREFYNKEFNPWYFLLILLLLGTLIYLNYWHLLERRYAAAGKTRLSNFLGYFLLYFIPFATAFLLWLVIFSIMS